MPSKEELGSLLPKFEIEPSEDYADYLVVRCLREECPSHFDGEIRPFVVHKRSFTRPLRSKIKPEIRYFTRPCPYCFRVSRLK